jgi:hypothetical protein
MYTLHMRDILEEFDNTYDLGVEDERRRILNEINRLEMQAHATRTPIYQETLFAKIREILGD